jgi:hypothetical protein
VALTEPCGKQWVVSDLILSSYFVLSFHKGLSLGEYLIHRDLVQCLSLQALDSSNRSNLPVDNCFRGLLEDALRET